MWINGPFKCGSFPDLKIFFLYVRACLSPGESVIADKGYHAGCCVTPRNVLASYAKMHRTFRARHETVNSRMKTFSFYPRRSDTHVCYTRFVFMQLPN